MQPEHCLHAVASYLQSLNDDTISHSQQTMFLGLVWWLQQTVDVGYLNMLDSTTLTAARITPVLGKCSFA